MQAGDCIVDATAAATIVIRGWFRVQSVRRSLDVLFAVAQADRPPTVSTLSSRLNLPRSTVHRILDTLLEAGVVARRGSERGYVITPKLALATSASQNTATLADMILPFLHRLVAIREETASLHIRVGDMRVCVAEVEGSRGIRWARGIGWSAPIWAGAVGRMLMTDMSGCDLDELLARSDLYSLASNTVTDRVRLSALIDEVRAQGWSSSVSETFDCAAAVAAPLTSAGGRTIAVLSLYASAERVAHMESLVPQLCSIAAEAAEQWDRISAFSTGNGESVNDLQKVM